MPSQLHLFRYEDESISEENDRKRFNYQNA